MHKTFALCHALQYYVCSFLADTGPHSFEGRGTWIKTVRLRAFAPQPSQCMGAWNPSCHEYSVNHLCAKNSSWMSQGFFIYSWVFWEPWYATWSSFPWLEAFWSVQVLLLVSCFHPEVSVIYHSGGLWFCRLSFLLKVETLTVPDKLPRHHLEGHCGVNGRFAHLSLTVLLTLLSCADSPLFSGSWCKQPSQSDLRSAGHWPH